MIIRTIQALFFLSIWSSEVVLGQESQPLISRYSIFDISYGLGGLWYLNNLDGYPKLGAHLEHGWLTSPVALGIQVGYESMEDEYFIPICMRLHKFHHRSDFFLSLGYAFTGNRQYELQEEFDTIGGLAFSFGYGYDFLKWKALKTSIQMGYELRRNQYQYRTVSGNHIRSRQNYHHLHIGLNTRF